MSARWSLHSFKYAVSSVCYRGINEPVNQNCSNSDKVELYFYFIFAVVNESFRKSLFFSVCVTFGEISSFILTSCPEGQLKVRGCPTF